MAGPRSLPALDEHHSSSDPGQRGSVMSNGVQRSFLSRRDSSMSNASFVSDVEMAHEEVFAGPMSESVPSSVTGFAHRRPRTDSIASFTYFHEEDESPNWSEDQAIADEEEESRETRNLDEEFEYDLESGITSLRPRRSSGFSHASVEGPLLYRHGSARTDLSVYDRNLRTIQKLYVLGEDLTIVIAGFVTNRTGLLLYLALCVCSGGLLYLLFHWMPRWRVKLVGSATPLRDCEWVVIENQWGEFAVQDIVKQSYGHSMSTVFGPHEKRRFVDDYDEDDDPVMSHLRFLDYRYIRLCFSPSQDKFVLVSDWKDPNWTDVKMMRVGLDSDERHRREQVFDKNQIDITEKSIIQLLVDEAFHPFYIFQIASLILWSLDSYYYYAVCIFVISVVSITTTLVETRSTMRRLREISRFECEVRVLRNGFWRQVTSAELVPGDVFEVSDPSLTQIPCDGLLLAGDCIINESMLTGESVPISKTPATDESLRLLDLKVPTMALEVARSFLFSGTKIIRARRPQDGPDDEAVALAKVVRTGFNTTKGALVRSMLFPKPSGFRFYKDAFHYIFVMAAVAGVGFIASFVNFVRLKLAWHLIIVRALDLITIVVPPALPATLSIGTNFALSRLRKKQIFCISPQRVNVGGKLDVICFDKTGTITEDGLDVLGVRIVNQTTMKFSDILGNAQALLPEHFYERSISDDLRVNQAVLHTMATCHSLRDIDGDVLGDPLDVKMFEFTQWSFKEFAQRMEFDDEDGPNQPSSIARPPVWMNTSTIETEAHPGNAHIELGTLKSFEFVSHLRRASVIVGQSGSSGADIYVKGAPESMRGICNPDSFPIDYEEILSYYTHRGFRVIACATKHIDGLNWKRVQQMTRYEAESSLDFLGFIIFENKLKEATLRVVEELHDAGIRQMMCTGDNILTAISVGRECSLIDRTAHCFIPHFMEGNPRDPKARLKWQSIDNPLFELDPDTLMPLPAPPECDTSLPYEATNLRNYSIAVSGDVFRWIIEFGNQEVLKRMLVRGQIFARMSPDEKHELVEKLQSIEYCCGFCGDGANDCGALKTADVGISLSEAEASVAAPFTSRVFDISCVPEVIREGRAALVTSFCCFKYMSLYSAIQFSTVSFLYASASNLGDFQFLFIDIFLVLPIAIFLGWTGAYPTLSRKRPTSSLVSRKVLIPLLGQVLLCIFIQAVTFEWIQKQSWYIPPHVKKNKSNIKNSQNTALFTISCFQYIFSGVVLSVGPPFRQSLRHNLPFVITVAGTTLFSVYMLLDPSAWLTHLMQLTPMDSRFKIAILLLAFVGFFSAWFAERMCFLWLANWVGKAKDTLFPHHRKRKKEYKRLLVDMRI